MQATPGLVYKFFQNTLNFISKSPKHSKFQNHIPNKSIAIITQLFLQNVATFNIANKVQAAPSKQHVFQSLINRLSFPTMCSNLIVVYQYDGDSADGAHQANSAGA
jgi:hypothetical protein